MRPADEGAFRTLRIIHGAMILAIVVYGLVAVLLVARGAIPPGGFAPRVFPLLRLALYAVAAAEVAIIVRLGRRLLSPEYLARQRSGSPAGRLQASYVILFALWDSVAVYGLILFLLGRGDLDFAVLAGAALLGLLLHTPRRDQWDRLLGEVEEAQGRGMG